MANTKIPSELVAINAISGTLIADNAITSVHIAENNITAVQIAINAVTALQMADGTITSAKIADGTIVTADIADGQITTGKLADSSVTTGKIAAGTIASADIANNAILTQHIDDNQITADQIADNAVGVDQLAGITRGSVLTGNAAGNPSLLALGAANTLLQSDGTDLVFAPLQSGIDDNSNAVAITIDISENVGIGVAPRAKLDVMQTTNRTSKTGTTRGVLHLQDGDTPANNELTAITFESNSNNAASIIGQALTNNGSSLFFGTSNNYGSGVTNTTMTINHVGNVGIGTDNPTAKLTVAGDLTIGTGTQAVNGDGTLTIRKGDAFAGLDFKSARTAGNIGGPRFYNTSSTSVPAAQFLIEVDGSYNFYNGTSGAQNRLKIDASGNVGIGHTLPKSKLSIVGDGSLNTYSGVIGIENTATDKWGSITLTDDIDTTSASSNYYLIGRGSTYAQRYMSFHVPTAANYGSGSQPKFVFASTGGDELFTLEASTGDAYHKGKVGIGVTAPHSTANLQINDASDSRLIIYETGTSPYTSTLELSSQAIGTYGATVQYTSGAERLTLENYGRSISAGSYAGSIAFKTKLNNTTPTEVMFIHGFTGNVGIGTTAPTHQLNVVGASGTDVVQSIRNPSTSWSQYALTRYGSETADLRYMDFGYYRGSSEATRGLVIKSQANASLVTFLDSGNVGIGTSTPQAKLSVNTPLTNSSADMRALDIVVPGSWSQSGNAGYTSDITWTNNTGSGSIMGKFGLRYSGTTTNGSCEWVFKDMYQGGYAASGDIMFIGSNGIVLTPKQPAFRVDQTGASGLSTGNYTVAFSEPAGTSFDIGNNFSSNVFTAPVAGTYHFSTSCRVDGAGVPYFRILISKNNSTDANTNLHSIYGSPAATYENLQVSGHLYLAQGDTARVIINSNSDGSWNSQGEGHFSGHLIG